MTFIPLGMKLAFGALFLWWLIITGFLISQGCHREKLKFAFWLLFGFALFHWAWAAVSGVTHPILPVL